MLDQLSGYKRSVASFYYSEDSAMKSKILTMLDKRWNKFNDYKQDVLDRLPMVEDKLMSVLCTVNTDYQVRYLNSFLLLE